MLLSNQLPAKRISCLNPECSHSITASLYARALQVHVQSICAQSITASLYARALQVHVQAICAQSITASLYARAHASTCTGNM